MGTHEVCSECGDNNIGFKGEEEENDVSPEKAE